MKGSCENCKKKETCNRATGIIFGGCNIDFIPANKKEPLKDLSNKTGETKHDA